MSSISQPPASFGERFVVLGVARIAVRIPLHAKFGLGAGSKKVPPNRGSQPPAQPTEIKSKSWWPRAESSCRHLILPFRARGGRPNASRGLVANLSPGPSCLSQPTQIIHVSFRPPRFESWRAHQQPRALVQLRLRGRCRQLLGRTAENAASGCDLSAPRAYSVVRAITARPKRGETP
jgi:hypothetical protein